MDYAASLRAKLIPARNMKEPCSQIRVRLDYMHII